MCRFLYPPYFSFLFHYLFASFAFESFDFKAFHKRLNAGTKLSRRACGVLTVDCDCGDLEVFDKDVRRYRAFVTPVFAELDLFVNNAVGMVVFDKLRDVFATTFDFFMFHISRAL